LCGITTNVDVFFSNFLDENDKCGCLDSLLNCRPQIIIHWEKNCVTEKSSSRIINTFNWYQLTNILLVSSVPNNDDCRNMFSRPRHSICVSLCPNFILFFFSPTKLVYLIFFSFSILAIARPKIYLQNSSTLSKCNMLSWLYLAIDDIYQQANKLILRFVE
jgi:hypothetical protein